MIMVRLMAVALIAFCVLFALRLRHLIHVGWAVITAPLWIYAGIAVVVVILFFALKIERQRPE